MTRLVVIIGFCVAFAAGLTVGLAKRGNVEQSTAPAAPTSRSSHRGSSFLASELSLTPDQQEQLKKIWEPSRGGRDEHERRRRELREKRDGAVEALIRDEDKAKFQQAMDDYRKGQEALDREMREGFRSKVEATKKILTPEQTVKYEEFLSRRDWGRDRERPTTTRRSEPAQNLNQAS
jgi:Spy/CpxP family protein refolding chaperone